MGSSSKSLSKSGTRLLRRPRRRNSTNTDSLDYDDACSVCSSVSTFSASSTGSGSWKRNGAAKKRVRFNDNRFTGRNNVTCTVETFDRVEERDAVWWTASDMRAMKRQDARIAKSDDAKVYLSDSCRIFLEHVKNNNNNKQQQQQHSVTSSAAASSSSFEDMVLGLDERYRGLERCHGPTSEDRKFHGQQTVRSIVYMYRKTKNAPSKSKSKAMDVHEQVRTYALDLTENMRNMAALYGKVDAMRVQEE